MNNNNDWSDSFTKPLLLTSEQSQYDNDTDTHNHQHQLQQEQEHALKIKSSESFELSSDDDNTSTQNGNNNWSENVWQCCSSRLTNSTRLRRMVCSNWTSDDPPVITLPSWCCYKSHASLQQQQQHSSSVPRSSISMSVSPSQDDNDSRDEENKEHNANKDDESYGHQETSTSNKVTVKLCENENVVRYFKFVFMTVFFLVVVHLTVRFVGWEHDPNYTLTTLFTYDLTSILFLDTTVYFLLAQWHLRPGIDQLFPTLLFVTLGTLLPSAINTLPFLQHSLTLYEVHCRWPAPMFFFVFLLLSIIVMVVGRHVRHWWHHGLLVCKTLQIVACLLVGLGPFVGKASFHLHHYYYSWLLGMHANAVPQDLLVSPPAAAAAGGVGGGGGVVAGAGAAAAASLWWSTATSAYLWGQYLNGVAVYGRAPVLGCEYSFYLSTSQLQCGYMDCFEKKNGTHHHHGGGGNGTDSGGGYKPFVPPDWRNCSAEGG